MVYTWLEFYLIQTNLYAEFIALLHGIQLCHSLGIFYVLIECDSKVVVDFVDQRTAYPLRYRDIMQQVCDLVSSFDFHLCHIFREANAIVD